MRLRSWLTAPALGPLYRGAEALVGRRTRRALEVWTYHRVSATTELEQHFDLLLRRAAPVSIDAVLAAFRGGEPLPDRAVLITFDDGYADLAERAWPLLEERGIPALLFVPTGFVGGGTFWWDALGDALEQRDHGALTLCDGASLYWRDPGQKRLAWKALRRHLKRLGPRELDEEVARLLAELDTEPRASDLLDWNRLRDLRRRGLAVAPHGVNHWMLPTLPFDEQLRELEGSLQELQRQQLDPAPVVAYPSGHFAPETLEAARVAGLALGFTTLPGLNRVGSTDPLLLRRIDVPDGTRTTELRARRLRAAALPSDGPEPARWTG